MGMSTGNVSFKSWSTRYVHARQPETVGTCDMSDTIEQFIFSDAVNWNVLRKCIAVDMRFQQTHIQEGESYKSLTSLAWPY